MGRSSNSKKSGAHKGSSQRDAAAVPATSQPEGKKRKLKGPDDRPSEQARPSKSRAQGGVAEVHRNGAQADGVASVKAGNKSFVDGLFAKAVTQAGPAPGAKRPPDAHTRAAEKRSSKASKVRFSTHVMPGWGSCRSGRSANPLHSMSRASCSSKCDAACTQLLLICGMLRLPAAHPCMQLMPSLLKASPHSRLLSYCVRSNSHTKRLRKHWRQAGACAFHFHFGHFGTDI